MTLFKRFKESVARVEKRVDDHFAHRKELRDERVLYGLEINVPHVRDGSMPSVMHTDPHIAAFNRGNPLYYRKDAEGKRVPVFHTDVGHQFSGRLFPYVTAVREPESLDAGELEALLKHPEVKKSAPQFRIEQLTALLEKKKMEEAANSKKR